MGAGTARTAAPEQLLKLAIVAVDIARVGIVDAMVDSGAMVSVVRKDFVQKLLKEENKTGGFILGFDKTRVPIFGEIQLTVRFGCKVVDLTRVKVVEQSVYPIILGAEWIEKGDVIIYASNGRLMAQVRTSDVNAALSTLINIPSFNPRQTEVDPKLNDLYTGVVLDQDPIDVSRNGSTDVVGHTPLLDRPQQTLYRPSETWNRGLEIIEEQLEEIESEKGMMDFLGAITLEESGK